MGGKVSLGEKGRKALSDKYESECITTTEDGIEVSVRGLIYLWRRGLVCEPSVLLPGKDKKTLNYNKIIIEHINIMADSIREESGMKLWVFYKKDYQMDWFMMEKEFGDQLNPAKVWTKIRSERKFWKWKSRSPGDITYVDFARQSKEDPKEEEE